MVVAGGGVVGVLGVPVVLVLFVAIVVLVAAYDYLQSNSMLALQAIH